MKLSTQEILEGLIAQKPDAFRHLYREYGDMIIGHVRKNSGSEEDAREVIHTVILKFWNIVREGRYNDQGRLGAFIYTLTANTWRDELRRRKVRMSEPLDPARHQQSDEDGIEEAIVRNRQIEAIHQCLPQLASPCSEIIRLFHLEEVSLQDIAVQMNYDYNNLRKRIFDCRKKLKKLVEDFMKKNTHSIDISHGK
ncbi:MAG: RNA polymerase sigma factor [Saprospiraceae bacterium]